jgi:hypothetical protein
MSTVLNFLAGLKLTLQQWLLILLAAAVTALAFALHMSLGKLHISQTALLEAKYGNDVTGQDQLVAASRAKFLTALKAFREGK